MQWKLTIPHNSDRTDSGVRIAIHYGDGDSYAQNILADGVDTGGAQNDILTRSITLPAGKTCENCVLQWMWAARADGGYYLGCSDIRISNDADPGPGAPNRPQPGLPGWVWALAVGGIGGFVGGAVLAFYSQRQGPGREEGIELSHNRDPDLEATGTAGWTGAASAPKPQPSQPEPRRKQEKPAGKAAGKGAGRKLTATPSKALPQLGGEWADTTEDYKAYLEHDRPTYQNNGYFLYFWEDPKDPSGNGWYIAAEVAGEDVAASNTAHNSSEVPPGAGDWEVLGTREKGFGFKMGR